MSGCRIPETVSDGSDRPNVVVILTDDQRCDCLGIAPRPLLGMKTPHLDRLAQLLRQTGAVPDKMPLDQGVKTELPEESIR